MAQRRRFADSPRVPVALAPVLALLVTMLLGAGGVWRAAGQEATPNPNQVVAPPGTSTEPPAQPTVVVPPATTPSPGSPAAAPVSDPAAEYDPNAPHAQVIANGLVSLEAPVGWRVREIAPLTADNAPSEVGGFSFTLQRAGVSVIRNDVTSKRARLEVGEAYFMSADDPYTRRSEGAAASVAWVIELVPSNAPPIDPVRDGTVLFAASNPYTFNSATYDAELTRSTLLANESAALPNHTGPALVMVGLGNIEVGDGVNPPTTLTAGQGVVADGPLTLTNRLPEPAVYIVASIGEQVEASTGEPIPAATTPAAPGSPQATAAAAPGGAAIPDVQPTAAPGAGPPAAVPTEGDTDGDGLSDADEAALASDPLNADYDADGILDGREVNELGTDPLNYDTDGDGLLDGPEVDQYGTSPVVFDTDGDGVSDGDEVFTFGTNPLDPASGP